MIVCVCVCILYIQTVMLGLNVGSYG